MKSYDPTEGLSLVGVLDRYVTYEFHLGPFLCNNIITNII